MRESACPSLNLAKVEQACKEQMLKDPRGVTISNVRGWQSHGNALDLDGFQEVKRELIKNIIDFTSSCLKNCTITIANSWINISGPGSSNNIHIHPTCEFAGVYYVKVPEKSGNLKFYSEFQRQTEFELYREELAGQHNLFPSYWVPSRTGSLMFFPANLMHCVEANESNEERVSIAFNLKIELSGPG